MRSISRRDLYALGEPIGASATRAKPGGRVLGGGGGGGPTQITNWPDMTTPVYDAFTQWQSDVNANTEAAANAIADSRTSIQANYNAEVVTPWKNAQLELITKQKNNADNSLILQQAAIIAIKTAIDLVVADKIDKRMRDIASDQMSLANRQMNMGEALHARYIAKFAPLEDSVADFAKTDWETNRFKPQYALQQGRAKLDAARAFGKAAAKISKKFTRYCTGANANMIRQTHTDWARMEVDMTNRAWRDEEARMWARDDVQWGRLQNAISNGQRLPSQAAADIGNGIRTATEANAVRGQAMQGWYGAIARGVGSVYDFAMTQSYVSRNAQYGQIPQIANTMYPTGNSVGSLGTPGMTSDVSVGQITGGQVQETNLGSLDGVISDVPQIAPNLG